MGVVIDLNPHVHMFVTKGTDHQKQWIKSFFLFFLPWIPIKCSCLEKVKKKCNFTSFHNKPFTFPSSPGLSQYTARKVASFNKPFQE